jgi:hypothetical protein
MSYRNAVRDIATGSCWQSGDGAIVSVVQAVAHHVIVRDGGRRAEMPETEFRARFAPVYDRERIRAQFTMSLANLGDFRVYWLPDYKRIVCRSVCCRRQFRVPSGALLVGTYGEPCAPSTFFQALDELIAGSRVLTQQVQACD